LKEQRSLLQNERKQVFNASSQPIIALCFGKLIRGKRANIFLSVPTQREQESSDLHFLAGFNMTKGNID